MPLTGAQLKRIHETILAAYTSSKLRRVVRFCMDAELSQIVSEEDFATQVFELVEWADKEGRIIELVRCAQDGNPGNEALRALREELENGTPKTPAVALGTPQPFGAPHQVFLAYSRKDAALMQRLRADLHSAGIACWIDEADLEPGTAQWQRAVEAALWAAQCVVVLLSPDAKESEWVNIEISRAKRFKRRIIPVLVRGSDEDAVPLVLETTQYVDVRSDFAGGVQGKLIPALRRHLAVGAAAEPVAATQPEPSPVIDRAVQLAIEWVTIPAGEFLMGSDRQKDKQAFDDETPQHKVYLPEYRIARVPVMVAQFALFVQATGYVTTAEQKGSARVWTGAKWEDVAGANWQHPRGPDSDVRQKQKHPVTCVSWHDAQAFCAWADVRLPSEAEWEKAARGTDGRIWPWGNDAPDVGHCNFNMNVGDTTPVGMYPTGKSPYGVLDMAGNVWEWTRSLWGPDPKTPQFGYPYRAGDGRENLNAPDTVLRTLRGGAWNFVDNVRCASRGNHSPDVRYSNVGFRLLSPGF